MKKLLLVFCILLVANFLHAQITLTAPQFQTKLHGFKSNITRSTTIPWNTNLYPNYNNELQKGLQQAQSNIDNMPVVEVGQVNLTLHGNNNQGFIVYSTTPDNMPVVKPDANFQSLMPIVSNINDNPPSKP